MLRKKWVCVNCGHEFETPWIPSQFVKCPNCGSNLVHRIDQLRGKGFGNRFRRGLCRMRNVLK